MCKSVARPPRRGYAHWRAASLMLVYVLITAHIMHWLITGKTLAPLELNEVMYTLELGIVTAGFVFMTVALLATAVFGRFFCSWGCHILALQDLCTWILRKLNIRRPRGIRSRVLLWVPLGAALYMFAWPQVVRLWEGRDLPELRVTVDHDGWASFVTEDFWRNLPGPGVALITFAVCGFLIVYVLGSRGFCTYGCPYGALFRVADRVAPGRIRAGPDCIQCGACTAACPSHVRVHEELARYGMVVDPACLKDLNCVAVCPQRSVHFGFGRPALIPTRMSDTVVHKVRDFAWWEETIMAAVFLLVLVIYRGLYDRVPFLLSIAVGAIGAYLCIVFLRLLRQPEVKLNRLRLKQHGRILLAGWLFSAATGLAVLATVHSAAVRYHTHQGRRHLNLSRQADADGRHTTTALAHLEVVDRWGLLPTRSNDAMPAQLYV
ncbi:MAG: 4Fe-4S binding protein, partial [Planctomycetes bacterium]|nr:4Fe-4S binding protein [Planctomycetota bacterium]